MGNTRGEVVLTSTNLLSKLFILFLALFGSNLLSSATDGQTAVDEDLRSAQLLNAIQKSAGVYQDPLRNPSLSKTLIITGCNYGYIDFLRNFKCFTDRLKLKVLVFSMDAKTHGHIEDKMGPSVSSFLWSGKEVVSEEAASFRSSQFNIITHSKTSVALAVIELGYDVLFIDVDIALIRDPMPYLLWRNVDYAFSHNTICPHSKKWEFHKSKEEGNTGFYYVRSNEKTIRHWKNVLRIAPLHVDLDDQSVFWIQIRSSKDPIIHPLTKCIDYNIKSNNTSELVVCPLNGCVFSAGGLRGTQYDRLRENLKMQKEKAVALHANYRIGSDLKVKDLRDHGYWLLGKNPDDACQKFIPSL